MPDATASWTYAACGVVLRSDIELPGLQPGSGHADAVVRRGAVESPDRFPASGIAAWPAPEADVLSWAGRGRLCIAAEAITVDGDDEAFLRQCVVGPGLGVLLHRRGHLVLHGSAVDVDGRAVVLLGRKGAGKSTTAAALLDRGHRLLTDDLVVLNRDAAGMWNVAPGPTQMKLWPEVADRFGIKVAPFLDGLAKGVWHGAEPASGAVPVAGVCALGWGAALATSTLKGAEAFGAVFEHAYAPRFLGPEAGARLMPPCSSLVADVRVTRFERPQDLDRLGDTADRLEVFTSGPRTGG